MIGIIEGQFISTKLKTPDKEKGQDFKPYHIHSIMQVYDDDPEIVRIKDTGRKWQFKANQPVKVLCRINHWSNTNASGQSITILNVIEK